MRFRLSLALILFLSFTVAPAAYATPNDYTCDLSGNPYNQFHGCHSDLNPQGSTSYAVTGNADSSQIACSSGSNCAARAGGLAVAPICAWGTCAWVDSDASNAYFVPFRTYNEWSSFIGAVQSGHVPGVTVTAAVLPYGGAEYIDIAPPYDDCTGQQTPTPQVYGRGGYSTWSPGQNPVCNCHQSGINEAVSYVETSVIWEADYDQHNHSQCSWTPHICYGPDVDLSIHTATNLSPASSVTVDAGSSITLSWNAAGASSCQASGGWSGSKPASGSETLAVSNSNTYTLTCAASCGVNTHATVKVVVTSPPVAACGSDAGKTLANPPTYLCSNGSTVNDFTTTSTGWSWNCLTGSNGVYTSGYYCSATSQTCLQPHNGQCGNANGETFSSAPTTGLCAEGTATTVNPTTGPGPWSWSCLGENGGQSANCSAQPQPQPPVCGECGSANGVAVSSAPSTDLCAAGTSSSVAGNGPWNWYCYGTNGGSTVSCSAPVLHTPVCGECGSANGSTVGSAPATNLCSAGTPSTVSGNGPWTWTCNGTYGGSNTSCSANPLPPVNGQCGSSNGGSFTSAPSANLCSVGTSSTISGNGPWSWTCSGSNGGTTASCSAQLQQCPINGQCGSANGSTVTSAPSANLCSAGSASAVSGNGPWSWTCSGSYGGTNATCSASLPPPPVCGECGSANGSTTGTAPTSNLCSVGTPSTVSGNGPWTWSCSGANGGSAASCSASPPPPPVCGECGSANGGTFTSAPTANLCAVGTPNPNPPTGNGPWTWICSGANGGSAASCSARILPQCAPGTETRAW